MPSTIRDVAKLAQVSIATVSRVVNNNPAVSPSTRDKVLRAIAELNYTPSPTARRLSLGRTHTIAIALPLFTLPSFVERLRGVHNALRGSEYDLVLYNVENAEQRDEYFAKLSHPSLVDALLLVSLPPSDKDAERFVQSNVPTVLVDAFHPSLSRVVIDDVDGGYQATRHLIELGHTRIAYLSDYLDTPFHQSMRHRYQGYRKALAEAGIPFRAEYQVQEKHGRREAQLMAKRLLRLPTPPTAIFAASDTQAIGIMDAARALGVSIPGQLSIVGFDDIRDAEYVDLTTIYQPLYQSGVMGVELILMALEEGLKTPKEIVLPVKLIQRNTTAPPASDEL